MLLLLIIIHDQRKIRLVLYRFVEMACPCSGLSTVFGAYVVFVVCKGGAGDMEPLAAATFDLASLKPRGKWDLSDTMLCIDLKPCFSESKQSPSYNLPSFQKWNRALTGPESRSRGLKSVSENGFCITERRHPSVSQSVCLTHGFLKFLCLILFSCPVQALFPANPADVFFCHLCSPTKVNRYWIIL